MKWLFLKKQKKITIKSGYSVINNHEKLLKKHQDLINRIYHHTHVPKDHFDKLYIPCLEILAIWSQDFPASQSHHHAHTGGFLLHTLEVIEIALSQRNTKMLPIGASVEKQNDKKDIYTYAVFVTALLHDVGKIINDINVIVYDKNYHELGRWSPWLNDITRINKAIFYKYEYNTNRQYQQHGLLPISFFREFIVAEGIDWLHGDADLFALVLMTLQGRYAEGGIIADIIKYSDSQSSSQSLTTNQQENNNQTIQQAPKSLADKLLDTLRHLVLETDIKMNQPGGKAFTTQTDIYFVSKVILDSIRENLHNNKQTGIPYDNARMMDELLQFHIVVPNDEGKAIWKTTISGGGFKKAVELTMLRVAIDKIYINGNVPESFNGNIDIGSKIISNNEIIDKTTGDITSIASSIVVEKNTIIEEPENIIKKATSSSLSLPPGFSPPKNPTSAVEDAPKQITPDTTKVVPETIVEKLIESATKEDDPNLGKNFFDWVKENINSHNITMNDSIAKVHIVDYMGEKAIFLVSPKIFKEQDREHWAKTQKQFTRLKINLKTPIKQENIWIVQTKTERKDKKPSKIRGYLIIKPEEHGFMNLPNPNKHLTLIVPKQQTQKDDK